MSEHPVADPATAGAATRDGRSTRWDPHRRQRRQAIIDAAVLAIETHGADALTARIAELANVPRTHVYRHFDGKAALDRAVSRHVAGQLGRRLRDALAAGGSPRELIRRAVDEHLAWLDEHPHLYRFLARNAWQVGAAEDGDAKAVFAHELTTLLSRYLVALGIVGTGTEQLSVGVVGLVDATAAWWLERHDIPRAEVADELTEQTWLLVERRARALGLTLAPDLPLPAL